MTKKFLAAFWSSHYIHIEVSLCIILSQLILLIETTIVRIGKDIIFKMIIKRGLAEDITNFLQMVNKLSSKKKR